MQTLQSSFKAVFTFTPVVFVGMEYSNYVYIKKTLQNKPATSIISVIDRIFVPSPSFQFWSQSNLLGSCTSGCLVELMEKRHNFSPIMQTSVNPLCFAQEHRERNTNQKDCLRVGGHEKGKILLNIYAIFKIQTKAYTWSECLSAIGMQNSKHWVRMC